METPQHLRTAFFYTKPDLAHQVWSWGNGTQILQQAETQTGDRITVLWHMQYCQIMELKFFSSTIINVLKKKKKRIRKIDVSQWIWCVENSLLGRGMERLSLLQEEHFVESRRQVWAAGSGKEIPGSWKYRAKSERMNPEVRAQRQRLWRRNYSEKLLGMGRWRNII